MEPKSYIKDDVGESGVVLGNTKSAGFIAQDIQKLEETREFVSESSSTGFLALNYDAVFTYAVAAVKELDAIVQSQAKTILDLQKRVENLENS